MNKEKCMSLFICGNCGKDTRKTNRDVVKVVLSGYSNILCRSCLMEFEDAVADVAKRYLRNSPKPRENKDEE